MFRENVKSNRGDRGRTGQVIFYTEVLAICSKKFESKNLFLEREL